MIKVFGGQESPQLAKLAQNRKSFKLRRFEQDRQALCSRQLGIVPVTTSPGAKELQFRT